MRATSPAPGPYVAQQSSPQEQSFICLGMIKVPRANPNPNKVIRNPMMATVAPSFQADTIAARKVGAALWLAFQHSQGAAMTRKRERLQQVQGVEDRHSTLQADISVAGLLTGSYRRSSGKQVPLWRPRTNCTWCYFHSTNA